MTARTRTTIKGDLKDITKFTRRIEKAAHESVTAAGLYMLDRVVGRDGTYTKTLVNKQPYTGSLGRSISESGVEVTGSLASGAIRAKFGSPLPYAKALEEGRPKGKGVPIVGTKTFNIPAKQVTVRGSYGKRKAHTRTIPAHPSTIKISALDGWLKNSRKGNMRGDSYQAMRERAGVAYRISKRYKERGRKGNWFMRTAVQKYRGKALALMQKKFAEWMKRTTAKGGAKP